MAMFTRPVRIAHGILSSIRTCFAQCRATHSKEQKRSLRPSYKASCESVPQSGERHASLAAAQFQKMWHERARMFYERREGAAQYTLNTRSHSDWQALAVHIYISHVLHVSINAHLVWIYSQANRIESEWYCAKVRAASPPFEVRSRHALLERRKDFLCKKYHITPTKTPVNSICHE